MRVAHFYRFWEVLRIPKTTQNRLKPIPEGVSSALHIPITFSIDFWRKNTTKIESNINAFLTPQGWELARLKPSKFDDSTTLFNDFSSFPLSQKNGKSIEKRFQNCSEFRVPFLIDFSSILGPKMGSKSSKNRLFGIPEGHQNFDFFQEAKKVDKKWVEGHWLGGE